ncbi:hypothetical protein CXF76_14340 [Pseudoalteromonas sp. 78C3]|uniref:hypothetical protein n=1 Tax=Pseudoalteromonas sp. 78C3 TaxID=2058300 RepID=UPI000C33716C|nr:hypothetical protein [Pseudoalteromonas sp. 78C3]PKH90877.1 hypothetical protein CXF76_14340 [Pseudoalteromonas sp. 78C3]
MISLVKLRDYQSPNVIDDNLKVSFRGFVGMDAGLDELRIKSVIFVLEIFLDCHDKRLSYLDFNRNLNSMFSDFAAFLYTEFNFSLSYKYSVIHYLKKILRLFCENEGFNEPHIVTCENKNISKNIVDSINNYNPSTQNISTLKYYHGWFTLSSDGKHVKLYLQNFYLKFGTDLTNKVSKAMADLFIRYPYSTAKYKAKVFSQVLSVLTKTLDNSDDFYSAGESIRVNKYVENIFLILKVNCKINNGNLPYFYKQWQSTVKLIQDIFIHSKLWGQPLYELFSPDFKQSDSNFKTHRKLINGQLTTNKLITNIPLHISDSKAIAILIKNISDDVDYVVKSCEQVIDSIMEKFRLRNDLAKSGIARGFNLNRQKTSEYIDMSIPENQCSTWNKWGYEISDSKKNHKSFLYIGVTARDFVHKYSIVQSGMLYPFLYLIVNEHPEITNSWLENFQLYDKNGNKSGFIESANSFIAVGYKLRKGSKNAEQKIVLTDKSKYLFECLELLTRQAREYMKKNNNKDYKYLLLSSDKLSNPKRLKNILTQSVLTSSELNKTLELNRSLLNNSDILNNLSVNKFRASRAILIYIKTNSLQAVSEALGHTRPCPKLLSRYLPTPILTYLQDRWIRVFQYAIIFEAMKDSTYLANIINFSKNDLDEFLSNHKLKLFSKHAVDGNFTNLDIHDVLGENIDDKYKLIIPMSTTLYSILSCIIDLVESEEQETRKPSDTTIEWYETAKFVVKTLDESLKRTSDPEILSIINHTYNKEPVLKRLKEVIYEV